MNSQPGDGAILSVSSDMDDQPELSTVQTSTLLADLLRAFNDVLRPVFDKCDQAAVRHQRAHRLITFIFVFCGTLAVLLAIVRMGLLSSAPHALAHGFQVAELIAVLLGLAAVIFGMLAAKQPFWLRERHKAECFRLLKFRMLADTDLWARGRDALGGWQERLRRETEAINTMDQKAMEAWAEEDKPRLSPHPPSSSGLPGEDVIRFVDYYIAKRIEVQSRYFLERSRQYETRDSKLRRLPAICFFSSVFCALLHSSIELIWHPQSNLNTVNNWLIPLAAGLPVIGAGIRTYRSAHEFARSASLFRAKHHYLENLKTDLRSQAGCNGAAARLVLCQCEEYLEREHREWLWLMREAEWIG